MKRHLQRLFFAVLTLLLAAGSVMAQSDVIEVTGQVFSGDDNLPLPGATVIIKGTQKGVATDIDGRFKLKAEMGSVLEINALGYEKQTVTVTSSELARITLKTDTKITSEVVVVGYGTQVRSEMVGSVEKVSGKIYENVSIPSFDAGLQGRAAGLQITQSAGVPGAAVKIRIRGGGAISGSASPLIVVDGMILYQGPLGNNDLSSRGDSPVNSTNFNTLANIDPNDIESVEILKDASAIAIYGARGANGVMIITTKSGKAGKTKFSFNHYSGFNQPTRRLPMLNGQEWMSLYQEARVNDGLQPLGPNEQFFVNGVGLTPSTIANTNWQDEMFRNGLVTETSLNANGGNDKSKFFVGATYRKDEGMLRGNSYDRISFRANLSNEASEYVKFGVQINPTFTINKMVPLSFNGGLGAAQSNALNVFPVRNPDGTFFGTQFANTGNNPLANLENKNTMTTFNGLGNLWAEIKFASWLRLRSSVQANLTNQNELFYTSPINRYFFAAPINQNIGLGALNERNVNVLNLMTSHTLSGDYQINEDHKIGGVVGFEINTIDQLDRGLFTVSNAAGFAEPNFERLSSRITWSPYATDVQKQGAPVGGYNSLFIERWSSTFGRFNYSFQKKYLAEISVRADGSSKFGPNQRIAIFPAVGAGWVLSEEAFMVENLPFISFAKLRASYGLSGNTPPGNFLWQFTALPSGGYAGNPGLSYTRLFNPNLGWASSNQFDLSLEWALASGRLSGTVSYYNKQTSNIIVDRPIPSSSTGYLNSFFRNETGALIQDQGVEFSLLSNNIVREDFTWKTSFNVAYNNNLVVRTPSDIQPDGFGDSPGDSRIIQGYQQGIHFLAEFAGVDPETGRELIYDLNGNKILATAESVPANRKAMGSPIPKWIGGLTNEFFYKGIDFSFTFSFMADITVYDDGAKRQVGGFLSTWNQRRDVLDRWRQPGDQTDVPRLTLATGAGNWNNTSRFLYDASFVRLRNVAIGYTFPKEWTTKAHLNSLRVFASATNLLTFTRYPGYDPEVVRYQFSASDGNIAFGAPYLQTPQMQTIIFGVNVGF